jgi:putative transposase
MKYAGLGVADPRRLRQLDDENRRLKRLVADLTRDKQMLQDSLLKSSEARREAGSGVRHEGFLPGHRAAGFWGFGLNPIHDSL